MVIKTKNCKHFFYSVNVMTKESILQSLYTLVLQNCFAVYDPTFDLFVVFDL